MVVCYFNFHLVSSCIQYWSTTVTCYEVNGFGQINKSHSNGYNGNVNLWTTLNTSDWHCDNMLLYLPLVMAHVICVSLVWTIFPTNLRLCSICVKLPPPVSSYDLILILFYFTSIIYCSPCCRVYEWLSLVLTPTEWTEIRTSNRGPSQVHFG